MKLQLGKIEVSEDDGKAVMKVSQSIGGISATVELQRIEAIKLRNWLNNYINGEFDEHEHEQADDKDARAKKNSRIV